MKSLFLFSLIVILLTACGNERDVRDFYYPVRELTGGLVYEYEPLSGIDDRPIYWYALAVDQDTALYLTITTYDSTFTPATLVREKLTNGGVITKELRVFATDSTGRSRESQAEIMAGNAFPFYLNPAEKPAYVYRARYAAPDAEQTKITLTYNRQYLRDTTFNFAGETHAALLFKLAGETDINDPVNGSLTPKFTGYEIYAKRIGLVESYRNFDGFILHNRLKDRFPMPEFQHRPNESTKLIPRLHNLLHPTQNPVFRPSGAHAERGR